MSQAGILSDSTTALADVEKLTGDSGGAVTPDASKNINILGDDSTVNDTDGITVVGDPGNNKLTVTLTNRAVGTGSTSGAVTTDLITLDLGSTAGSYIFDIKVAGFESTTPAGCGYTMFASARTTGAAATVISTPYQDIDEDLVLNSAKIEFIASGNNVIVRATGVVALDINWLAKLEYIFVS